MAGSRSIKVFTYFYNNNNKNKKRSQLQAESSCSSRSNKDTNKKMKMMMNRCSSSNANANAKGGDHILNNNISIINYALVDGDFVISEILVRLPVKTLMRFKSVCKRWMSSINHDPHFHQLHFKHSKTRRSPLRLLTIRYPYEPSTGYQVSDANLIYGVAYHTFQQWDDLLCVNGLACFFDMARGAVRIFNPSTRQETQWIKLTKTYGGTRILFGFDPVTNKHKVLCYQSKSAHSHEVLTVGDNSWRRIAHDHQVPNNSNLRGPSVYVNGAIYWMENISRTHSMNIWDNRPPEVLVVFDVGTEKFRVIPIPDSIINQPRDETYRYCRGLFTCELLEVNGRIALLRRKNKNTVSMWMLFDVDGHHQKCNWNEVVITLTFNWVRKDSFIHYENIPGTDQIILKPYIGGVGSAYSHNWKNNTSKKLKFRDALCGPVAITDDTPPPEPLKQRSPFVESLFPVISSSMPQ